MTTIIGTLNCFGNIEYLTIFKGTQQHKDREAVKAFPLLFEQVLQGNTE